MSFKDSPKIQLLKNLILYGLFGAIGAAIDMGISSLLVHFEVFRDFAILGFTVKGLIIASLIGNLAGFAFTFTTNTFLNFKKSDKLLKRFIYYGSVCVVGMIVSSLLLNALAPYLNQYLLKALVLVFVSGCQFVFNKFFTYKD